jgi:hypothetical protein
MKASTFFSVLLLSILVVVVLEFSLYTDKTGQQNFSDTTEFTTYNKTDTLQRGVFNVVGVNSADDTLRLTIDTKSYQASDVMVSSDNKEISTSWRSESDFMLKTTNSKLEYIVPNTINWSGWYGVISITEVKPHF